MPTDPTGNTALATSYSSQVTFDPELLDNAIAESGLAREYDLDPAVMRGLAANAQVLMALVVAIEREQDYDGFLASFNSPKNIAEFSFLFAMAEHIRGTLLKGLMEVDELLKMRSLTQSRLERAYAKCRVAVLDVM